MRFLILLFALCLSLFATKNITFGSPPFQDPTIVHRAHKPLMDFLEKRLEIKINHLVSKDYNNLVTLMENGEIDLATYPSGLYVKAKQQMPELHYIATMLLKDSDGKLTDHYRGVIAVAGDSSIRNLFMIKGKRIGFTDKRSSSGYVYPMLHLMEKGIDPDKDFAGVFMLKKHNKVIEALMKGLIDVGATYEASIVETNRKIPNSLSIISKTPEIPFDAIAASPDLDDSLVKKLQKAFLEFKPTPTKWDQINVSKTSPQGFSLRSDSFYDIVRHANEKIRNKK